MAPIPLSFSPFFSIGFIVYLFIFCLEMMLPTKNTQTIKIPVDIKYASEPDLDQSRKSSMVSSNPLIPI